jgi:hypothetical protein
MSFNYPVHLSFEDFLNRLEVKMAKVIHVRDDHEELVSFKPQKFSLSAELHWLKNYSVVESRFDAETEELFIRIV